MSMPSTLLDQAARILLNLKADLYTPEQTESASEVLESILRRHYKGGANDQGK